jgi:hypothetical protein
MPSDKLQKLKDSSKTQSLSTNTSILDPKEESKLIEELNQIDMEFGFKFPKTYKNQKLENLWIAFYDNLREACIKKYVYKHQVKAFIAKFESLKAVSEMEDYLRYLSDQIMSRDSQIDEQSSLLAMEEANILINDIIIMLGTKSKIRTFLQAYYEDNVPANVQLALNSLPDENSLIQLGDDGERKSYDLNSKALSKTDLQDLLDIFNNTKETIKENDFDSYLSDSTSEDNNSKLTNSNVLNKLKAQIPKETKKIQDNSIPKVTEPILSNKRNKGLNDLLNK